MKKKTNLFTILTIVQHDNGKHKYLTTPEE